MARSKKTRTAEELEKLRQKHNADARAWNAANPDRCRATAKRRQERAKADPVLRAKLTAAADRSRYKRLYGITIEERDAAVLAQNNRCLICDALNPKATDHCHGTGKFRAMLCNTCNVFIGFIEVSEERHRRALEYIAKYKARP